MNHTKFFLKNKFLQAIKGVKGPLFTWFNGFLVFFYPLFRRISCSLSMKIYLLNAITIHYTLHIDI